MLGLFEKIAENLLTPQFCVIYSKVYS